MDVRFLCDETIDQSIAVALRMHGYDVLTAGDADLLGADDQQAILPFALEARRVLDTRDADFLALHAAGQGHAGIAFWPGKRRNVREAIHYLRQLGRQETAESMVRAIRFVRGTYP